MVVKNIGNLFLLNNLSSSILDLISSSQEKPNGDEGSMKPKHISTTISAEDLPIARFVDWRVVNYLVTKAGEAGADKLVSFKQFALISSMEPPKLNISIGDLTLLISSLSFSVATVLIEPFSITTP